MSTLEIAAKNCLFNCGGPIEAEDTTDGLAYVMVRRTDFDALQLALAKKDHLINHPVIVTADRYKGFAVAVHDQEPDGKVACLLENGNVWWYPIETVRLSTWKELPRSNRRTYLAWRGINTIR